MRCLEPQRRANHANVRPSVHGHIAAAAPGAVVVLDRELNVKSFVTFSGEAVDNGIAIGGEAFHR
jgi:hypothetical protein